MKKYIPAPPILFCNIPLTGVLRPGTTVGYIANSKYIQGGYVVVQNLEERDALLDTSVYEDREAIINGSPVYVAEENKVYRRNTSTDTWEEDTANHQEIVAQLNNLKDTLNSLSIQKADQSYVDLQVRNLVIADSNRYTKQETDNLLNYKVDNNHFENVYASIVDQLNTKADKSQIPTKVSQLQNDNHYIDNSTYQLLNYYTKDVIDENEVWDLSTPTIYTVGGLPAGSVIKCMKIKDILERILYNALNPTLKDPKLAVTLNNCIGVAGQELNIEGTVYFFRGLISPDYSGGGDAPRTGPATSYEVNGTIYNTTDILCAFHINIPEVKAGDNTFTAKVNFEQGKQPVNSIGDNYDSPYPAGSLETQFTIMGLTNSYSGTVASGDKMDEISTTVITDTSVTSYEKVGIFEDEGHDGRVDGKGYQVTTPASTAQGDAPYVLLPAFADVIGIKGFNAIYGKWDWYKGATAEESLDAESFIKSASTVVRNVNGQDIEYYTYTYNVAKYGTMGVNHFRFYIA